MSPSRRLALAAAAFLAAAPALAGCAAGFDSVVERPYSPTEAATLKTDRLTISQAFLLGPDAGGNLPAGGSTPLYLSVVNTGESADTLTGVTAEGLGTVKIASPIALPVNQFVSTTSTPPKVEGLSKPLHGGESVKLTLQFANAGNVAIHVPVITRSREFAGLPAVPGAVAPPTPAPSTSPAGETADHGGGH